MCSERTNTSVLFSQSSATFYIYITIIKGGGDAIVICVI